MVQNHHAILFEYKYSIYFLAPHAVVSWLFISAALAMSYPLQSGGYHIEVLTLTTLKMLNLVASGGGKYEAFVDVYF